MKRAIQAFYAPFVLLLAGLVFSLIEMMIKGYFELWYSLLVPFALAFIVAFIAEKTRLFPLHFLAGAFLVGAVIVLLVFPQYTPIGMIVGAILIWALVVARLILWIMGKRNRRS